MIDFTDGQKKTIAAGITVLSLSLVFAFTAFVLWVVFKVLSFASSAIIPVVLGFFLSLFFKPYYEWWQRHVRNPSLALAAMLLTIFVPLGFFLWYAGAVTIDQISNLIRQGPTMANHVVEWFKATFPKSVSLLDQLGVRYDSLGNIYTNYGGAALKAGTGALKFVGGILSALVTLIFFVFFLTSKPRRGSDIVSQLTFLKPETRDFAAEQIDAFVEILVSFFQRQTVICLIEGVYYGLGFALVGLPYGFLIGFMLGVLNLVPLFGTVVCLPVAMPLAYFGVGGSTTRLVLVLVVWAIGQVLDGYLITPKIQGNKTGLGYAGVIFSFFFWGTILGPVLGLLLAIPLSAFCVVLWRALKSKYIRPVV
ncbi:MAG: AI-2E family transporter [Kiritimatiellae bacterium]|nr:AI-2E family transporter [Kiritimatiellia bacterium]